MADLRDYGKLSKKENKYVLIIVDGDKAAHSLIVKDKEAINSVGQLILNSLLEAIDNKNK